MTQAETTELLEILRELEGWGWRFRVYLDDDSGPNTNGIVRHLATECVVFFLGDDLEAGDIFRREAVMREMIESEVEARGLWRPYVGKLAADSHGEWLIPKSRPSLLEVARAALAVAKQMSNA